MAVGIMILSNENGKETATMITATKENAKSLGETFSLPAYRYMGADNPKSIEWISRAWEWIDATYAANNS